MNYTIVIKDAFRQIFGRLMSAFSGFFVTILLTQNFGPLRYGDYTTILSYFALWSALADLGLYVIGLRELGNLKTECGITDSASFDAASPSVKKRLSVALSQFVWSRLAQIVLVYGVALAIAYCIPSYLSNPYIARGLPLGMLFSALFMMAGILQLPLQLFWRMEHVSIGLILARVSQLLFLFGILYGGWWDVSGDNLPVSLFVAVIASVVVSSCAQLLYTFWMGSRVVPLCFTPFLGHMWQHIKDNGRYGAAFFLSSFHLLIVALLFSLLYPTMQGFVYVGIWGLALQLVQILLILPSSLANSMIHRISGISLLQQQHSFGQMILIMVWLGALCASNFFIFSPHIIYFISGSRYMSTEGFVWTFEGLQTLFHAVFSADQLPLALNHISLGADIVLPFLGVILALSFIKTVFNYIFVATKEQNVLLPVNLFGVIIGGSLATFLVYSYTIVGGIVAQFLMEFLFVVGSLWYAHKRNIMPIFSKSKVVLILGFFVIVSLFAFLFPLVDYQVKLHFVIYFVVYNTLVFALRYKFLKGLFKSMSDYTSDVVLETSYESVL